MRQLIVTTDDAETYIINYGQGNEEDWFWEVLDTHKNVLDKGKNYDEDNEALIDAFDKIIELLTFAEEADHFLDFEEERF